MRDLLKRWSETSEQLQANERRLSVKQSEIAGLEKNCEELRTHLGAKNDELTKLEALSKDNVRRDLLRQVSITYTMFFFHFTVHSN